MDAEQLCLNCGLCCNGVIFADVKLQPNDDAARLKSLGLRISVPHSGSDTAKLKQPCAAFDGCRCRIYGERPKYCQQFECALLKAVKTTRIEPVTALRLIGVAKRGVERVSQLLSAVGDTDTKAALAARFRRTAKRLEQSAPDNETAEKYSELTLAIHELNCLLSESFYPGTEQVLTQR